MSHQGYASALRSGTEECNLSASFLEVIGIVLDRIPRLLGDSVLKVLQICKAHMEGSVDLDQSQKPDLQQGDVFWTKKP